MLRIIRHITTTRARIVSGCCREWPTPPEPRVGLTRLHGGRGQQDALSARTDRSDTMPYRNNRCRARFIDVQRPST